MPDYIYLLENRLSPDQRNALSHLREVAREAGTILFLTGDAVRDLTSGHAVRDLEVSVHGNALKLKKPLEKLGAKVWGEDEASKSLYLCFPGTVRVDVISTHRLEYPKPGKPVFHTASIHEDLRRRDFTVNAMAISLNEGSFGLLMDPLNGAADIEARILRLVSNYGFIEDPSLLIRATRYKTRLSWELDLKSQTRYENAKNDGVIEFLSAHSRSRELEQIGHEEEGLKVLEALEAEGWMKVLYPAWTRAKADEAKLQALHDFAAELLMQGVHADTSAAQMVLLTSGLSSKDLSALKKLMLRPGFVEEWDSLDNLASGFSKVLLSKPYATPSEAYKLFTSYDPEAILWLGFTSKTAAVRERYDQFLKVWPQSRQSIPHALMQEMRITPELPIYTDLIHQIFLQLIDGKLTTPEEMRAFLEPHSPPAPPPQITIKRPRAKRGAEKIKVIDDDDEAEDGLSDDDDDLDDMGGDDDDFSLNIPKGDLESVIPDEGDEDLDEDDPEPPPPAPKPSKKSASASPVTAKAADRVDGGKAGSKAADEKPLKAEKPVKAEKITAPVPQAPAAKAKPQASAAKKVVPAAKAAKPVKVAAKPAGKVAVKVAVKVAPPRKQPVKPVSKSSSKPPVKKPVKPVAKHPNKPVAKLTKPAPSKKTKPAAKPAKSAHAAKPSKQPAKKPAHKAGKKR